MVVVRDATVKGLSRSRQTKAKVRPVLAEEVGMSTGAECDIVEEEPGKWYLRVQEYPYGCNEEYDKTGPHKSEDAALDYLDNNYANPGGYSVTSYEELTRMRERRAAR
jgi:hypothetical protein